MYNNDQSYNNMIQPNNNMMNQSPMPNQPKSNKGIIIIIIAIVLVILIAGGTTAFILLSNNDSKDNTKEVDNKKDNDKEKDDEEEKKDEKIIWEEVTYNLGDIDKFENLTFDFPVEWYYLYAGGDKIKFPMPEYATKEQGRIWGNYVWQIYENSWHKDVKEDGSTDVTYFETYRADYDPEIPDVKVQAHVKIDNNTLKSSIIQNKASWSSIHDSDYITDFIYCLNENYPGYIITRTYDRNIEKEYSLFIPYDGQYILFDITVIAPDERAADEYARKYFELYSMTTEYEYVKNNGKKWTDNMDNR